MYYSFVDNDLQLEEFRSIMSFQRAEMHTGTLFEEYVPIERFAIG